MIMRSIFLLAAFCCGFASAYRSKGNKQLTVLNYMFFLHRKWRCSNNEYGKYNNNYIANLRDFFCPWDRTTSTGPHRIIACAQSGACADHSHGHWYRYMARNAYTSGSPWCLAGNRSYRTSTACSCYFASCPILSLSCMLVAKKQMVQHHVHRQNGVHSCMQCRHIVLDNLHCHHQVGESCNHADSTPIPWLRIGLAAVYTGWR